MEENKEDDLPILKVTHVVAPYSLTFLVMACDSMETMADYVEEKYASLDREHIANAHGYSMIVENPDAFLLLIRHVDGFPEHYHMENIAHEALHIAWYMLDHVGVKIDVDNHEALAYLQGHLMSLARSVYLEYVEERNKNT